MALTWAAMVGVEDQLVFGGTHCCFSQGAAALVTRIVRDIFIQGWQWSSAISILDTESWARHDFMCIHNGGHARLHHRWRYSRRLWSNSTRDRRPTRHDSRLAAQKEGMVGFLSTVYFHCL